MLRFDPECRLLSTQGVQMPQVLERGNVNELHMKRRDTR
jgi:hypothetical protein